MEEPRMIAALEARISRLERSAHRSRLGALVLAGVAAIALTTAQTGTLPTTIGDATGAHLTLAPSGIAIFDSSGQRRAFIGLTPNGSYLYDTHGQQRLDASLDLKGLPGFGVMGPTGKYILEAFGDAQGGFFRTHNNDGTIRSYIGIYDDGSSGAAIYNAAGTVTWKAP